MNATTNKGNTTTPAVKKATAGRKSTAPRKSASKKAVSQRAAPSAETSKPQVNPVSISAEERWRMVATAAYHKAEKRGFASGHEVEDWLAAENDIDAVLKPK